MIVRLQPDGAVLVEERITYEFLGSFEGAYRDIPFRSGETIDRVQVGEGGTFYASGGCVELGCSDAPGTFGTVVVGDRLQSRLALPRERRAADVHGLLPVPWVWPSPTMTWST